MNCKHRWQCALAGCHNTLAPAQPAAMARVLQVRSTASRHTLMAHQNTLRHLAGGACYEGSQMRLPRRRHLVINQ